MNTKSLIVLGATAALMTGCGAGDGGLSRTEVEDRVAKEVGKTEGARASAACVEGSADRTFRCKVKIAMKIANVTRAYEARVSKDGERVQIDER